VAGWDADDYEAIKQNLEGLTTGIPDMSIGKVPRHFQRHTIGVAGPLRRLLRRVGHAVVCYRE
jgi:hypothetical protein